MVYYYRNVRCRNEMFDQDIIILQYAASIMDPNEFLITMMHKFSLMSWQRSDYDKTYCWNRDRTEIKKTLIGLEEFLVHLVYIIAER